MVGKYLKRRWMTVVAIALAAFLAGTLTAFSMDGRQAATVADSGHAGQAQMSMSSTTDNKGSKAALHDSMRKLWEQHVAWTRLAISEFAAGSGGFGSTATRLLQNQTDIGNAFKPFFGDANGAKLAALLHDHITIAVEILQAAKAGDTAALNDATTRWYANANDIADFLSRLNPKSWPQTTMREMMKVHLDQTLAEANNILTGKFAASVTDYDQIETHILEMADTLSNGIIAAVPSEFN
jgi:hypothetical protein